MATEFHWILAGRLAGAAEPGLVHPLEEDLSFLRQAGIKLVVSLGERRPSIAYAEYGLQSAHFPIGDGSFPPPRSARVLCQLIEASLEEDGPVLLHGRAGTMFAAFLLLRGFSPDRAVEHLRRISPDYIRSEAEIAYLRRLAGLLGEGAMPSRHRDAASSHGG